LLSRLDEVGIHFANLKADIETANKQYVEQIKEKDGKKDGKNAEKKRKRDERLAAERRAIHAALEELTFKPQS
jgi:hypothetical protein